MGDNVPSSSRDRGAGTIQAVHADLATVLWDSGELDEGVPVGRAGQYYLRPADHEGASEAYSQPARSQSPAPAANGSTLPQGPPCDLSRANSARSP